MLSEKIKLETLPYEILSHVCGFFGIKEQARLQLVSRFFHQFINYCDWVLKVFEIKTNRDEEAKKIWFKKLNPMYKLNFHEKHKKDHHKKSFFKKVWHTLNNYPDDVDKFLTRFSSPEIFKEYHLNISYLQEEFKKISNKKKFLPTFKEPKLLELWVSNNLIKNIILIIEEVMNSNENSVPILFYFHKYLKMVQANIELPHSRIPLPALQETCYTP